MLKLSGRSGNPLVALKIKLGKAVFPFKVALIVTVNMFLPISNIDPIKPKNIWLAKHQARRI